MGNAQLCISLEPEKKFELKECPPIICLIFLIFISSCEDKRSVLINPVRDKCAVLFFVLVGCR